MTTNLINIEKYNKIIKINHFIRQHANIPKDINKYNENKLGNKLGNITTYI
jgi:hypothetical protein